jgi:hypothetical protein
MEGKQDDQEKRKPGEIEQGGRCSARQERAHVVQVPDRLDAFVASHPDAQPNHRVIDPSGQCLVENRADANQDASANDVDETLAREQNGCEDAKADQRRHAPAGQHAVINLEHEHGAGQRQHAAHAAQQADAGKCNPAGLECGHQLGAGGHARLVRLGRRRVGATMPSAKTDSSWQIASEVESSSRKAAEHAQQTHCRKPTPPRGITSPAKLAAF